MDTALGLGLRVCAYIHHMYICKICVGPLSQEGVIFLEVEYFRAVQGGGSAQRSRRMVTFGANFGTLHSPDTQNCMTLVSCSTMSFQV